MREKLISTSVLDILVSSFAFVSIIVAVLTYCIAYFAGQGTSSGGYNMIYLRQPLKIHFYLYNFRFNAKIE